MLGLGRLSSAKKAAAGRLLLLLVLVRLIIAEQTACRWLCGALLVAKQASTLRLACLSGAATKKTATLLRLRRRCGTAEKAPAWL